MIILNVLAYFKASECSKERLELLGLPSQMINECSMGDERSIKLISEVFKKSLDSFCSSLESLRSTKKKLCLSFDELIGENNKHLDEKTDMDDLYIYLKILCEIFLKVDEQPEIIKKIKNFFKKLESKEIKINEENKINYIFDTLRSQMQAAINCAVNIKKMINICYFKNSYDHDVLLEIINSLCNLYHKIMININEISKFLDQINVILSNSSVRHESAKDANINLYFYLGKNKSTLHHLIKNIILFVNHVNEIQEQVEFTNLYELSESLKNFKICDIRYLTRVLLYLKVIIPLNKYINARLAEIENNIKGNVKKQSKASLLEELFDLVYKRYLTKNANKFISDYSSFLCLNEHMKINIFYDGGDFNYETIQFDDDDDESRINEFLTKIKENKTIYEVLADKLIEKRAQINHRIHVANEEMINYVTQAIPDLSKEMAINLLIKCKTKKAFVFEGYGIIRAEVLRCVSWRSLTYKIEIQSLHETINYMLELFELDRSLYDFLYTSYLQCYIFELDLSNKKVDNN